MKTIGAREYEQLRQRALPLLPSAAGQTVDFLRLSGGRNNRVYRARVGNSDYCIKWYFTERSGDHKRQSAEQRFSEWCEHRKAPAPRLIAVDLDAAISIFSWIDGRKIAANEVDEVVCRQMAQFIHNLNPPIGTQDIAAAITDGAEACFSIDEHFRCVESRLRRFAKLTSDNPLARSAATLIKNEIDPHFRTCEEALRKRVERAGADWERRLDPTERILSPSDFGLHNALRKTDGSLAFFDFEYAGWDDAAKTICDAVCQTDPPIPTELVPEFARQLANLSGAGGDAVMQRANWLLPLYQIKWCCILLNEFQADDQARRDFAQGDAAGIAASRARDERLAELESQLKKAELMAKRLKDGSGGLS